MRHQGTRQLTTERLVLRRFGSSDAEAMHRNWASDERVTRFLTWRPHADVAETRRVLAEWVAAYDNPSWYQWAIVPKTLGEPIGSISVVALDESVGQVEVGYCIGVPWWRQGYTSEALEAVIGYLFDVVGVLRIQSRHDSNNPNSGRVMVKCGLRYEGTLRGADRNNQGIVDACMYGLLSSDRGRVGDE